MNTLRRIYNFVCAKFLDFFSLFTGLKKKPPPSTVSGEARVGKMTVLEMKSPLTPASSGSPPCPEPQLPVDTSSSGASPPPPSTKPALSFSVDALLADEPKRPRHRTNTWHQTWPEDLSPTDLSHHRRTPATSSDDEVDATSSTPLRPTPAYGFQPQMHPSALWSPNAAIAAAAAAAAAAHHPAFFPSHFAHAPLNGKSSFSLSCNESRKFPSPIEQKSLLPSDSRELPQNSSFPPPPFFFFFEISESIGYRGHYAISWKKNRTDIEHPNQLIISSAPDQIKRPSRD